MLRQLLSLFFIAVMAELPTSKRSKPKVESEAKTPGIAKKNPKPKQWGVLLQIFRHYRSKHGVVMSAIVNITQIELEEESPLFPIYYDDSYDVV